jgi:3-methyladenine DNA glycosylase AlkD
MNAHSLLDTLKGLADPEIAAHSLRFFKTGPGEYGEGDKFLGIRVPVLRTIAKSHLALDLEEIAILLGSPYHEVRLIAVLILSLKYPKADPATQNVIYNFYCEHTHGINNWDLVDSSADKIVGAHLHSRDRAPLYKLGQSENLWERRISIVSTLDFIRKNDFADTLKLSEKLLNDSHDLIHKAVGWMLREVGKRDQDRLLPFLDQHAEIMPRTMLRYAIERLPEPLRLGYLHNSRRP